MYMYTDKHLHDCLSMCRSEKMYIWNRSKIGILHFFYERFCRSINQEHKLLPVFAFSPFTYVYCENCLSGFYVFILNLSKSGNILFRSVSNGNFMFSSASIVIGGT